MKTTGLILGLIMASIGCASAQVTVEVTQSQEQFLPGEALKVAVRITNLSGQDLSLGGEEDWLTFSLESREGTVVPKLGEAPVLGAFVLESSKVATKRLDLAPYFMLTHSGRYQIVATVRVKGWNREIISSPKPFDVIEGAKLWEQEVGVPPPPGAVNAQPEVRRYILQQANYIRGKIRLYLRVTDQFGRSVQVFPLGPLVSFGRPEAQIDHASNLHVLYQDGAAAFSYVVCNFQGEIVKRQTYDYSESRPRLRVDDDGNVSIMGGVRRIAANDVPPPKEESSGDAASSPNRPTNQLSAAKPTPN